MSPLFLLGFPPALLSELDPDQFDRQSGLPPVARVSHIAHGLPTLLDPLGERPGTLVGALREAEGPHRPVVGDWVEVDHRDRVLRVLPRRSLLLRRDPHGGVLPLAANVDTVFITTSLNGDLNPRRIERFVAIVRSSGAEPVLVFTKADLHGAAPSEATAAAAGAPVVYTSALRGEVAGITPWTGPGRTVAFVGASGVGKSTLVNTWIGREVASTSPIGEDDRGHHTTTDRRLHRAPDGTLLIDLPGIREVGLIGDEDVGGDVFPEIAHLARGCRWRNCAHGDEPGCAVRAAIETGELDRVRWLAWVKLERERAWAATQADPALARTQRTEWKRRTAGARERDKLRTRNGW